MKTLDKNRSPVPSGVEFPSSSVPQRNMHQALEMHSSGYQAGKLLRLIVTEHRFLTRADADSFLVCLFDVPFLQYCKFYSILMAGRMT